MGGVLKASCVSHCYHHDGTASKGNLEQEESWIMVSEVSECMSGSIAFNSTVRQNITGEESGMCVCGKLFTLWQPGIRGVGKKRRSWCSR